MNRRRIGFFLSPFTGALLLISLQGCNNESPFSPKSSLNNLEVPDGFRIELVASEPLVRDPVDMAFDADGQLYVVEMPEYPSRGKGSPPSNIILLKDEDSDGVYDSRTVFAEDLPFVNGVMPWKDGILVTNAPDIIYFADTTGDGQADVRRVVLSGFAETNPQLRVSHLRYGIDNWIYGAYYRAAGSGGDPQFAGKGEPLFFPDGPEDTTFAIQAGMDFRFRPDENIAERSGGRSQFGNTLDAEGNRFTLMNSDHIRHVVIPQRYMSANPYYSITSSMASISDHGKATRLYSITENMQNFRMTEHEVGHVTSACGIKVYTGNIFPEKYQHASFVCDPARNVVHVDLLSRKGATFNAGLALNEEEFIASPDSWFRPVSAKVGPDGALYIVDMYRKLVEHPAFIPHSGVKTEDGAYVTQAGLITESDFYEGRELGRIYRIIPDDYDGSKYSPPKLKNASTAELVAQLSHPNMWWRITAQRLLVNRADLSAISSLRSLTREGSTAYGRMHALWTLEGLGELKNSDILDALEDKSPLVRKQAIILSEPQLANAEIGNKLLDLAIDPDAHVQFQLALTLSQYVDGPRFAPLLKIAEQHLEDVWFQSAISLSIVENPLAWFEKIYEFESTGEAAIQGKEDFLQIISSIIGVRQKGDEITELLAMIGSDIKGSNYQIASLSGLKSGLRQGQLPYEFPPPGVPELLKLIEGDQGVQIATLDLAELLKLNKTPKLKKLIDEATNMVLNEDAPSNKRGLSIRILGLDPNGLDSSLFTRLLSLQQPDSIQKAAATVLLKDASSSSIQLLLEKWDAYSLEVRNLVESGFLSNNKLALKLLTAVKDGHMEANALAQSSRSTLKQNPDKKIRNLANELFANLPANNRKEIVASYYESTTMDGDVSKGKTIFKSLCSACHQLGGVGFDVGPDLLSFTGNPKVQYLRAIINPNFDISPGYDAKIIQTKDGKLVSGVVVNQNDETIVLKMVGGSEQTLAKKNIKSVRSMAVSLMPDGLEESMSKQDMADLISYLKSFE